MTRFDSSPATKTFAAELAKLEARLPLRLSDQDVGVVLDADGHDVFTVDLNGDRPDEQVVAIALWLVTAANTCGGFVTETP